MKPILCLLFSFLFFNIHAQNLIPNPGFEDVNICEKYKEQCSPKAWRNVLLKGFRFPEVALLSNTREGIFPKQGLRAAIIPLFHKSRKDDRIYIQVPFLCELEKGKKYTFSFHYLLTEETTQSIGLIFSDSLSIRKTNDDFIGKTPDIEITLNDEPLFKTWQKFSIEYTAKGGEQGLILGNYMPDSEIEYTPTVKLKSHHYARRLTIWLDEFSLIPVDKLDAPCDMEVNLKRIYDDSVRHYIKNIVMHRDILQEKTEEKEPVVPAPTHASCFPKKEETEKPNPPIVAAKKEVGIANKIVLNQSFVLNNINFENNSTRLLASSYTELNRLLSTLQSNPNYRIQIIGHTDNVGSVADNMRLSRRRAEAVATYFIENGISISRISSLGRGENEPAFDNATEEGRRRNRRVEFVMK